MLWPSFRRAQGDSGGPVFIRKGGQDELIGLVSGRLEGIGAYAEDCAVGGVLITLLAPYESWVTAKQGPMTLAEVQVEPTNLTEACQLLSPGTPAGIFLDELLQEYVHLKRAASPKQTWNKLFLRCEGLEEASEWLREGRLPLTIRQQIPRGLTRLVESAGAIKVVDADTQALAALVGMHNLETLNVSGLRWGTDLSPLTGLHVRKLELRYGPCVRKLETAAKIRATGAEVILGDLKECSTKV